MKKVLSIFLSVALCFGIFSLSAYAEDVDVEGPNNIDATEYISPDAQLAQYLARTDVTAEQKEAAIAKHNLGQALANGNCVTRTVHASENILDVPWYSQTAKNYCGPASTKQTVQYINGSSDSQATIAEELETNASGTETNNIKNYLVSKTGYAYEVLWWWADANAFSDMVISDTDDDKPIIGHVIIPTKGDWLYTTTGHYLNYNGYSSSGEYFSVTDPYADRYGDADGKYSISNDEAERVTDRIVW